MLVPLSELRRHLRIDGSDHDVRLMELEMVAAEAVANHMNRKVYPDQASLDDAADATGIVITASIKHAIKLLVGQYDQNTEVNSATKLTEVPIAYRYLLSAYRIPAGGA